MPVTETNSVDPAATSPGAILKRCREYHELTLEEAEESTKIGANYLSALEDDQISQFASLAYLKGFLRIYATYLGLNPDDMIRLYEKLYAARHGRPENGGTANAGINEPPPRRKFPLQKLIMPAVILLLIIITAAIINRSPSRTDVKSQQTAASPAPVPVQQPGSSARRSDPRGQQAETAPERKPTETVPPAPKVQQKPSAETAKGFVVRLKVTQSGTLTVAIDGSTSPPYDLVVGDSIEWKADRTISLELSNAGGVEAELNGRVLKPFGQPGRPATIVLDSEGIRQ